MASNATSAAYDQVVALCGDEWCASARDIFGILEEWQQTEKGIGLYETTLYSMLLALGVSKDMLATWSYFFNTDKNGIISVSLPHCLPLRECD